MADLKGVDDTLPVRLGGVSLSSGLPDNYVDVNSNAQLLVFPANAGPVTPGAVAGNSGLMAGQYNTTQPILTNTQQSALQTNQFASITVAQRNKYKNVIGNATTVVKSGSGVLNGIIIGNSTTGGTATIYDNTAGSGTVIMAFTLPTGGVNPVPTGITMLGIEFTTGLTIVTAGSTQNNFTLTYQ